MKNKSVFDFERFKITKSLITTHSTQINNAIDINFALSAVVKKSEHSFLLQMKSKIENEDNSLLIEIHAEGLFLFPKEESFEQHADFFNFNAPSILFPYVRAHISSLTALCGITPLVLPPMSLGSLKQNLIENTKFEE
jgi:preprotein translocase subunit SecB